MHWAPLLHIYQPPWQKTGVLKKVARQSYWRIAHLLERHPRARITLNISGSLTEQLARNGFRPLLNSFRDLASHGQIEFTGSAKYHPILPLLPAQETIRQIQLNNKINKKYFGKWYTPKGFFPPEMCWKNTLTPILMKMGFEWVVLDEIAINPTLKNVNRRSAPCLKDRAGFCFFFRSRFASDLFSTAIIKSANQFFALVGTRRPHDVLITAFDGENLGHHSPTMDNRFEEIARHSSVHMHTYSELLNICPSVEGIRMRASSWSTRPGDLKKGIPYPLWNYPGNIIHKLQWEILNITLRAISSRKKDPRFWNARALLDEALASDQFWWASATPWWGTEEAYVGTVLFQRALNAAPPHSLVRTKKIVAKKLELLRSFLRQWQESGTADKIKSAFLRNESMTRFFGGEKVK